MWLMYLMKTNSQMKTIIPRDAGKCSELMLATIKKAWPNNAKNAGLMNSVL